MSPFKNIYHSKNEIIWILLFISLICFYIVMSTLANLDLTAGRFALFMDERITFDGVKNIINPSELKHFIYGFINAKADGYFVETTDKRLTYFWWSIIDGGDHRYGRSLFNSMAIFSYLPEYFFGESGQIFAGRMTQVIFLISAFTLLCVTFLKHWGLRFLLLASLLAMPYSAYFMSMPKPEPQQILFIAIFLVFFKKKKMSLKHNYWFYLGLAFGTKISTLPIIPVFLFAASLEYLQKKNYEEYITDLLEAFGYFLVGLGLAVPILLHNIVLSFVIYKLIDKYSALKSTPHILVIKIAGVIGLIILNFSIALILFYKFKFITALAIWGGSTFAHTGHGADQSNIGFIEWIKFFVNDWMIGPASITTILALIGCALIISFIVNKTNKSNYFQKVSLAPFFVLLAGITINLSIFLFTHRLWGFYLFPGTILIVVGFYNIAEYNLFNKPHKNINEKITYYSTILVLSLGATITFIWWLPHNINELNQLANRTKTNEYAIKYKSYVELTNILSSLAIERKKRLSVVIDPNMFIPNSNENYKINEFGGGNIDWQSNTDIIILSSSHKQDIQSGYDKYVIDNKMKCLQKKICYQRFFDLSDGSEILVSTLNLSRAIK